MNKDLSPLEALERLTNYKCSCMSEKIMCKEIIETALKALVVIRFKKVNIHSLLFIIDLNLKEGWKEYNKKNQFLPSLIQEEYNLLKEVLNNVY
ncbi:MAG: hypothetical protein J6S67_01110 [Methanobrevibacter sp.]|nr:hypothetical protein [Methanobrevibacter sp.]